MNTLSVILGAGALCIPIIGALSVNIIIHDLIAYWPKIEAALLMEPRP